MIPSIKATINWLRYLTTKFDIFFLYSYFLTNLFSFFSIFLSRSDTRQPEEDEEEEEEEILGSDDDEQEDPKDYIKGKRRKII